MVKTKALMIFLVLSVFAVICLFCFVIDNSTPEVLTPNSTSDISMSNSTSDVSIYNSTSNGSVYNSTSKFIIPNSAPNASFYNSSSGQVYYMQIDDDLRVIDGYWIFATRPDSKERHIQTILNSNHTDPSPDEMVEFLKKFDEKYPAVYELRGVTLFITVENKEALLSEISKEDIQMLREISDVLIG